MSATKPPDHVTPEIYRQFAGYEKLTNFFGYWPSFHDAEVLSVRLDRSGQERFEGPVAVIHFATFEWAQNPVTGETIIDHNCSVGMRFTKLDGLHMVSFNYQNAIYSLDISAETEGVHQGRWRIRIPGATGVDATFTCADIEVLSVTPGRPTDVFEPATP